MKTYAVGGAVRDELLGLPVKDRDYVVVGATPEELIRQGYKAVGKDFPVFLHPRTHEEYALARTERKTARGYHGFAFHAAPDVTLEQDLARRDLTINAIARDTDGGLVDPHNGAADLRAGVLRHVSPAFAEDPVRILRVARFAARFGFSVAPETLELMRRMVKSGEADALVPERVWQELARGFMEKKPSRMFTVLCESGAMPRILPELTSVCEHDEQSSSALAALDAGAAAGLNLEQRYAALLSRFDPLTVESLSGRLKVPAAARDLALLAARHAHAIALAYERGAQTLLELFNATDAWRRPQRFADLVAAVLAVENHAAPVRERLMRALQSAVAVDAGRIAQAAGGADEIRRRVNEARLAAIEATLDT